MWIIIPALLNVPQPRLIPHYNHAKHEAVSVVNASPTVFAELDKRCRLVLGLASPPPSLDLTFREVQLLCQTQKLRNERINELEII